MVARIPAQLVALVFALAGSAVCAQSTVLVDYDFDDQLLQPGPDTYRVFKTGGSRAAISYDMAQSGIAALHLSDPAFDGDFVEFQGYFTPQSSGSLTIEFGFLLPDAQSAFNVALVGDDKYRLGRNGINFWLFYDGEWLRSYSDSIPIKVIQPQTFQWYTVRATLDLDGRSYSLQVLDELGQPVFSKPDLILAPGRHAAHNVREYSFVSDITDRRSGDFLIDNFSIHSSNKVEVEPLVAPGRKKLFVDRWKEYQQGVVGKLQCVPARELEDFSIGIDELVTFLGDSQMHILLALTSDNAPVSRTKLDQLHPSLRALQYWRNSCAMLSSGDFEAANADIEQALALSPDAFIFQLTRIIINARTRPSAEVFYDLSSLEQDDMRKDIALAMIALYQHPDDGVDYSEFPELPDDVAARLRGLTAEQRFELGRDEKLLAVERLKLFMPEVWEAYLSWYLALELQYFQLLGTGEYQQAAHFTAEVAEQLSALSLGNSIWLERAGDTALLLDQPELAIQQYQLIDQGEKWHRVQLKLSDAYFLLGDFERERQLRESIYTNFDQE